MNNIKAWLTNSDLDEMVKSRRLHLEDYNELVETRNTIKINLLSVTLIIAIVLATAAHSYVS